MGPAANYLIGFKVVFAYGALAVMAMMRHGTHAVVALVVGGLFAMGLRILCG